MMKIITRPHRLRRLLRILAGILFGLVLLVAALFLFDRIQNQRVNRTLSAELTRTAQSLQIGDAWLSFRKSGEAGEPLLLIHGFLGSSDDFRLIMADLAAGYQVVAVDLIGFGLSDKNTDLDYSKKNMAVLADQLMRQLGHDRYHVLGHSMGGEVALNIALEWPEHVDRLILLDSAGTQNMQEHFTRPVPAPVQDLFFKNYLIQRLFYPLTFASQKAARTADFDRLYFFSSQIPADTLNQLILDNDSGQVRTRLSGIRQPTLLVWGDRDRVIPLAQGYALAAAIPSNRLVVLADCGHLPYLEKPQELVREILAFLAER